MLNLNFTRSLTALVIMLCILAGAFYAGNRLGLKEAKRWEQNYKAETDSLISELRNDQTLYMAQTVSLTRAEFKQYMETEWKQLVKDYKLKGIEQVTNMETITRYYIKTTLRDSTVRDTTRVKVMDYKSAWLDVNALIEADTINLSYQHRLGLQLAISRQKRQGFINKVLLKPITRPLQITAIPSDTNTKITYLKHYFVK